MTDPAAAPPADPAPLPDALSPSPSAVFSGESPVPARFRGTAAKIFVLLLLALLPLAVATTIVNSLSLRTAERDKTALIRAATAQNAARIAANVTIIRTTGMLAANILTDPAPGNVCARMQALFRSMAGPGGTRVILFDRAGTIRCRSPQGAFLLAQARSLSLVDTPRDSRAHAIGPEDIGEAQLVPELGGLLIRTRSSDGTLTGLILYKRAALQRLGGVETRVPGQSIRLRQNGQTLFLAGSPPAVGTAYQTMRAPIGNRGLELLVTMETGQSAGARRLSLAMPMLLWLAAAFLGWLAVRWILVLPLAALRREVAAYRPGEVLVPPHTGRFVSDEISDLGEAFAAMSADVAAHEQDMQRALERQTRLTREVHHRVKNNLQIISSLISLHWRAAPDPQTGNAYLSIQRRVDALAVVQRNHYAELDARRGVRARPMLNEIASALKISAQVQSGRNLDIAVDCDDVYLHQDVAAPVAFMTAELADMVIAQNSDQRLTIALLRQEDAPDQARFTLASPAFRKMEDGTGGGVTLHERILTGLARQLRAPLEQDAVAGEFHIRIPLGA